MFILYGSLPRQEFKYIFLQFVTNLQSMNTENERFPFNKQKSHPTKLDFFSWKFATLIREYVLKPIRSTVCRGIRVNNFYLIDA